MGWCEGDGVLTRHKQAFRRQATMALRLPERRRNHDTWWHYRTVRIAGRGAAEYGPRAGSRTVRAYARPALRQALRAAPCSNPARSVPGRPLHTHADSKPEARGSVGRRRTHLAVIFARDPVRGCRGDDEGERV